MAARFRTAGATVEAASGRRPVKLRPSRLGGGDGPQSQALRRADRAAEGVGAAGQVAEA